MPQDGQGGHRGQRRRPIDGGPEGRRRQVVARAPAGVGLDGHAHRLAQEEGRQRAQAQPAGRGRPHPARGAPGEQPNQQWAEQEHPGAVLGGQGDVPLEDAARGGGRQGRHLRQTVMNTRRGQSITHWKRMVLVSL